MHAPGHHQLGSSGSYNSPASIFSRSVDITENLSPRRWAALRTAPSAVVEEAAGEPFARFISGQLFEPLARSAPSSRRPRASTRHFPLSELVLRTRKASRRRRRDCLAPDVPGSGSCSGRRSQRGERELGVNTFALHVADAFTRHQDRLTPQDRLEAADQSWPCPLRATARDHRLCYGGRPLGCGRDWTDERHSSSPSALLAATTACHVRATHPGQSIGIERYLPARDLYSLAETYRLKHQLPALGIGIIHKGRNPGSRHGGRARCRVRGLGDAQRCVRRRLMREVGDGHDCRDAGRAVEGAFGNDLLRGLSRDAECTSTPATRAGRWNCCCATARGSTTR